MNYYSLLALFSLLPFSWQRCYVRSDGLEQSAQLRLCQVSTALLRVMPTLSSLPMATMMAVAPALSKSVIPGATMRSGPEIGRMTASLGFAWQQALCQKDVLEPSWPSKREVFFILLFIEST